MIGNFDIDIFGDDEFNESSKHVKVKLIHYQSEHFNDAYPLLRATRR